jgi:hypothetical protein
MAKALHAPWPIRASHAALVIEARQPILPGWVDRVSSRGLTASYDIRIRGGHRYRWAFRDGVLTIEDSGAATSDVRISADPVAFLLVMYRRESQWRQIARGQILAWGRKPWLALSLVDRFHRP